MANPTGKGLKPFKKGQSGNPGGRPKGLMPMIRLATKGGAELVSFHLEVMRAKKSDVWAAADRLKAAAWLTERGFGKVVEQIEVSGPDGGPLAIQSFDYHAATSALAPGSMEDR